jgi:hypothetical protein
MSGHTIDIRRPTDDTFQLLNPKCDFFKVATLYRSNHFPQQQARAISTSFFITPQKSHKFLDYIRGFHDTWEFCETIRKEGGHPAPNLCFVMFVDESIFISQQKGTTRQEVEELNRDKQKVLDGLQALINNTKKELATPIHIQCVRWEGFYADGYHPGLLSTLFRCLLPMIDPSFEFNYCVDLDTDHAKKELFYQKTPTDKLIMHYLKSPLSTNVQHAKTPNVLYDSRNIDYLRQHSWDIFNMSKFFMELKMKNRSTHCASFLMQVAFCNMMSYRDDLVRIVDLVNQALVFAKSLSRAITALPPERDYGKPPKLNTADSGRQCMQLTCTVPNLKEYYSMSPESRNKTTIFADTLTYIQCRIFDSACANFANYRSNHTSKDFALSIFWKDEELPLDYPVMTQACMGNMPYYILTNMTYGIDELVMTGMVYPLLAMLGIFKLRDRNAPMDKWAPRGGRRRV